MSTTIFTGGLAYNITESHLRTYFSQFGTICKTEIARRKSGLSKGYGFIFFADSSGVSKALELEHHEVLGRKIDVQRAKERPQKQAYKELMKKCRVFVGGLSPDTTDQEFKKAFYSFGQVKSAYIIKDHFEHKSLGFGYVLFKDPKVSQKLFEMKTMEIKGHMVTLSPYKFKDGKRKGKKRGSSKLENVQKKKKTLNEGTGVQQQPVISRQGQHTPGKLLENQQGSRGQRSGEISSRSVSDQESRKSQRLKDVIAALPDRIHQRREMKVLGQFGNFDTGYLRIFAPEEERRRGEAYGKANLRFNLVERKWGGDRPEGSWNPFGFFDNHQ